ncbi:hypothetical protein BGZ61DRAFT_32902 [Ilyonectria robusta]|uniref:uncharacterized protein n=1 Tax=Ilyonectria robusta TaxID=1079257 RepID=UPI001E8D2987|nr:uncharacterized protein BGZ61DRAFT_32902 [Ilyonectria robusta]KAH8694600.1 hypothetical protein BGZ61DRAFT_32902 [Ilyonectria robusta]
MSQYILASSSGLLCLEKPKPNANPIFLQAEHEWTKSDLDEICQDLFKAVSLESPSQDSRTRQEKRATSKRPTKQGRLVNRDGIIIWSPPSKYPPRAGSCALASCSLESTMNFSSSQAHILALPVELRLRIYRHLLILEDFRLPTFYPSIGSLRTLARAKQRESLGISAQVLATCRQINWEGTPMLYGETCSVGSSTGRASGTRRGNIFGQCPTVVDSKQRTCIPYPAFPFSGSTSSGFSIMET